MIELGLIGNGDWGQNYVRTIRKLSNCRLPRRNIRTTDYQKLFANRRVVGIIIATPASTHFAIALDCLQHGFNVLVEKPLCLTAIQAQTLITTAAKNGLVGMVGHQYIYNPALIMLKHALPLIGPLQYIYSENVNHGKIRTDVSALWDWGPHEVSVSRFLLEHEPLSLSCWNLSMRRTRHSLTDLCFIRFNFPNRIRYLSRIGWLSPIKKREITIVGTKGALLFNDLAEAKLTHIRFARHSQRISPISHPHTLPLTTQVENFVSAINHDRQPTNGLREGLRVVKILEIAEKSGSLDGKTIQIPHSLADGRI